MEKIILSLLSLIVLMACNQAPEKPKLTVGEYAKQITIIKGVLDKILVEKDFKKMHTIALAVESSRAVNCISIGEECNIYGEILNKIVNATQKKLPNEEENVAIYKKMGELEVAFMEGQAKLVESWKVYINNHEKEK